MVIQCYLVPLALVRTSKLTSLLSVEKMDVSRFQSCKLRNACDSLLNIRTPARFGGVSSFIHLGMFNNVLLASYPGRSQIKSFVSKHVDRTTEWTERSLFFTDKEARLQSL